MADTHADVEEEKQNGKMSNNQGTIGTFSSPHFIYRGDKPMEEYHISSEEIKLFGAEKTAQVVNEVFDNLKKKIEELHFKIETFKNSEVDKLELLNECSEYSRLLNTPNLSEQNQTRLNELIADRILQIK